MHRDIKPENLILENTDNMKVNWYIKLVLADFGLSDHINNKNKIFTRCGTPGYVAPEILNDLPYEAKVDVFSAGVIFYIL
jgi:serine/threonine protein kinase